MLPIRFENGELILTSTSDTVPVFKALKKKGTEDVNKLFELLYHYCDIDSAFRDFEDEQRLENAWRVTYGNNKVKMTKELQSAAEEYKNIAYNGNPHYGAYEAVKIAYYKLQKRLKEIDLNETDDKGKPVNDISKVTKTVKEMQDVALAVETFKTKAEAKNFEKKKTTKDRAIGQYED